MSSEAKSVIPGNSTNLSEIMKNAALNYERGASLDYVERKKMIFISTL